MAHNHKEKERQQAREWYYANHEKVLAQAKIRYRARYSTDPEYRETICRRSRERHSRLKESDPAYAEKSRIRLAELKSITKRRPDTIRNRTKRAMSRFRQKQVELAGRSRSSACELCNQAGKVVFDHDHQTGSFRGWICDRCNRTLGAVRDDIALLTKMIDYLTYGGVVAKN